MDADQNPTQNPDPSAPDETSAVQLNKLGAGKSAHLHTTQLVGQERELLAALGLEDNSRLRLSKIGNPCIIQVNGTRIGLSKEVARQILVLPEEPLR